MAQVIQVTDTGVTPNRPTLLGVNSSFKAVPHPGGSDFRIVTVDGVSYTVSDTLADILAAANA
jgi:hypothetical protein